jgi:hypothetical protein
MTRDDIIRMAKEAGWQRVGRNPETGPEFPVLIDRLERFAALVAAEKEQQMIRDGWRKCAEGQRITQFCGLLDAAVKAEKELIAQWVESWGNDLTIKDIVEGIRTNGNGVTRPIKYVTRDSGEG